MLSGLLFLTFMPESPRFLVCTKQFAKAREVFAWIGKVNGLQAETIQARLNEITFEGEDSAESTNSLINQEATKNQYKIENKPKKSLRQTMKKSQMKDARFSFDYNSQEEKKNAEGRKGNGGTARRKKR